MDENTNASCYFIFFNISCGTCLKRNANVRKTQRELTNVNDVTKCTKESNQLLKNKSKCETPTLGVTVIITYYTHIDVPK